MIRPLFTVTPLSKELTHPYHVDTLESLTFQCALATCLQAEAPSPWNEDSELRLQGCLESTSWTVFKVDSNLDEYTESVLDYIGLCVDSCISTHNIFSTFYQKPWICNSVKQQLEDKEAAYRLADMDWYKRAPYGLRWAISDTKRETGAQLLRLWPKAHV